MLLHAVRVNKGFFSARKPIRRPGPIDNTKKKTAFLHLSRLLWEENCKPPNVWRCWDVYRGAHMSHFVRASGEGLAAEWRHQRRSACIKVEKEWERRERMGLNPPTSKLSPPAVSCDIYLLRWFCQKPSGLAVPPHSLICCLVLSWLSSEKEGSGGQPERPPEEKNMAHRVHLETPHTIAYTHKQCTRWCAGRGGGRAGAAGWGGSGIDYY